MKLKYFAFLVFSIICINLSAQVEISISKEKEMYNGKLYYIHEVKPGHTIFSIARVYNVSQDTILSANPFAKEGIQIGQFLRIPIAGAEKSPIVQKPTEIEPPITSKPETIKKTDNQLFEYDTLFIVYYVSQENLLLEQLANIFETDINFIKTYNPPFSQREVVRKNDIIYIPLTDSKFISKYLSKNIETQVFTLIKHNVKKRETLYSLSRMYEISINEIKRFNPGLSENLTEGQHIWVPAKHAFQIEEHITIKKVVECVKVETKQTYNVALLVPFNLNRMHEIVIHTDPKKNVNTNFASFEYIQFYEGFLLALDEVNLNKAKINLSVYDVGDNEDQIKNLISRGLLDVDMIIGPFFSSPFEVLNEYAKGKNIKILDLYLSSNPKKSNNNPNSVSILPSVNSQLKGIVNFISENHSNHNVIVMFSDNPNENSLVEIVKASIGQANNTYHFVNYTQSGLSGLLSKVSNDKQNIIISFSNNEIFLNNFLRGLFDAAEKRPITIFGLPGWLRFESIDLRYLNHFNAHFFSSFFVDYKSAAVQKFVSTFQEKYKTDPNRMAFLGYDTGLFFLSSLTQFGKDFNHCLNKTETPLISTKFYFEQIEEDSQWINSFVNVFKINNYELFDARNKDIKIPIE